jgi:hypothetical protein
MMMRESDGFGEGHSPAASADFRRESGLPDFCGELRLLKSVAPAPVTTRRAPP